MELNELLGIGDFMLVEQSYAAQKEIGRTLEYLGKVKEGDVAESIRIFAETRNKSKEKELIGITIYDRDLGFWMVMPINSFSLLLFLVSANIRIDSATSPSLTLPRYSSVLPISF